MLNPVTLKKEKSFTADLSSSTINEYAGAYEQMNFNGSHPVVYKNQFMIMLDSLKLSVFDLAGEKLLWKKAISTNPNQLPIIADGNLIVTNKSGSLISYQLKSGTAKLINARAKNIDGQPVFSNGFVYLPSEDGLEIHKIEILGNWSQWNKSSGHNTYWD